MCRFNNNDICLCKTDGHGGAIKCKPCSLKQTEKEYRVSLTAAYKRINSLSEKEQKHISEKYYGGLRPWEVI